MSYSYEYERPALTVDGVIFTVAPGVLKVLLIQRLHDPFEGHWALPGGFFDMSDDSAEDAVARELFEETGLGDLTLEQFFTFSKRGRDPRGRTVSIAFYAVVPEGSLRPVAGDDAKAVAFYDVAELPPLAFDHEFVIAKAIERLRTAESQLKRLDESAFERVRRESFPCEKTLPPPPKG